jgi:hypothetical protein
LLLKMMIHVCGIWLGSGTVYTRSSCGNREALSSNGKVGVSHLQHATICGVPCENCPECRPLLNHLLPGYLTPFHQLCFFLPPSLPSFHPSFVPTKSWDCISSCSWNYNTT